MCTLSNHSSSTLQFPTVSLTDNILTYSVINSYNPSYGSSEFGIKLSKTSLAIHGAITNNVNVLVNSYIHTCLC